MASLYALLLLLSYLRLHPSAATDTITATQFLKDPDTIISENKIFTFGFFSTPNSTLRYVGIWYSRPSVKDVIWVANKKSPLIDASGVLRVSMDGNLQVLNGKSQVLWSSNVSDIVVGNNFSAAAQILDSGNLVLRSKGDVLWQSFDHPTDSWLPNMKMTTTRNLNEKRALRSWKSPSDPSDGQFTLGFDGLILPQIVIWDGDRPHWRSGPWNGNYLIGVQFNFIDFINAQMVVSSDKEERVSATYFYRNKSLLSTYKVSTEGNMIQIWWDETERSWEVEWQAITTECDVYGKCGAFGTCNPQRTTICQCPKGFEPQNKAEWSKGNWSNGCKRMKQLQCIKGDGKDDGFLRLKMMKVPDHVEWRLGLNQDRCRTQCLNSCSCLAYAYDTGVGCMTWSTTLVDMQEFSVGGVDLYLRVANSELGPNKVNAMIAVIGGLLGTAVLAIPLCFLWRRRARQQGQKKSQVTLKELPLFKFETLAAATNNFSESNKLGRGGFGTVYRGIDEDGQEIAVKRLSRAFGQGLDQFMNEVAVMSKLQHRNLVRLLGCAVEDEEKILVYEYMSNKSLDAFIFGRGVQIYKSTPLNNTAISSLASMCDPPSAPEKKRILDWKKRMNIIEGICRGLEYLHKDSRLRIIHRDLKTSNILLDRELNPKISDFGMARIFGGEQDQANTVRVVGTYGYMSPEYAMEGLFSEKSDVFSFGVLLLEIISGERNSIFSDDEQSLSLLGYAWKLWNEKNIISLIDPVIAEPCYEADILRCLHVGLLCVQELAIDRPSIPTVVSMLNGDISDLPHPNKPGFAHISNDVSSSEENQQDSSLNYIPITGVGGR